MHDLYVYLFCGLEQNSEPEQWRNVVTALHDAVHEKLPQSTQCIVCTGSRLRQDKRWKNTDWNFDAVRLLWTAVVSTIDEHGVGWSAWRSMDAPTTQQPLPPTLQMSQGLCLRQPQVRPRTAIIVLFGDRSITALPSSPLHADPASPMPSTPAPHSVQTSDDALSSPLIGTPDKNDVVLPRECRALTFLRSCKKASHP